MKKILLLFITTFSFLAHADFLTGEKYYNERKYQDAFNELLPVAETGDFQAKYYVGRMYLYGLGIEQDEKKGLEHIQSSANDGYGEAQALLGYLYNEGKIVPQNKKKAIELFMAATNQNNSSALIQLGVAYYKGDGVEKDNNKAIDLFNRVPIDKEHPYVGRYLGEAYMSSNIENKLEKAKKEFLKSAQMDDVESFYNLGQIYEQENNVEEALKYYEYAASKGSKTAQYHLGEMYIKGIGVGKDLIRGCAWWKMAAFYDYKPAKEALLKQRKEMTVGQYQKAKKEFDRLADEVMDKIDSPLFRIYEHYHSHNHSWGVKKPRR